MPYTKSYIDEINRFIRTKKTEIERAIKRLIKEKRADFSADELIVRLSNYGRKNYLFYYLEMEIVGKQKSNRYGTAGIYVSMRNSLKRFTQNKNITFGEINYRFVMEYIDHLRGRNVCENSIHMYLRYLRAVYNRARKDGLITSKNYPFEDIRMGGTKTTKRALDKEMLRRIVNLDLSGEPILEGVRDIFLFSFYTRGMSLVDILYLKHANIQDGCIHYTRNKTHQQFHVAVTPQAKALIDKYHSDETEYVWPYLNESSPVSLYRQYRKGVSAINLYLKCIGKRAGIDKPLTSYVARHSWATIAKTEGIPIASISEGLGHTIEKQHKYISKVSITI